ncbi:hypothetical protein S83_020714 [Arachis hypogaea]|nr:uncharacterized protein DS421_16g568450 [Arachis hypogaea]
MVQGVCPLKIYTLLRLKQSLLHLNNYSEPKKICNVEEKEQGKVWPSLQTTSQLFQSMSEHFFTIVINFFPSVGSLMLFTSSHGTEIPINDENFFYYLMTD